MARVSRREAAPRIQESLALVPTEASAQAVRAFRGVSGTVTIRGQFTGTVTEVRRPATCYTCGA